MAQIKGKIQQKKAATQIRKSAKKLSKAAKSAIIICFVIGIGIGAAVCAYISREDGFSLNGEKEITVSVGAHYTEQGATVVSLGKDLSEQIQISGTVDTVTAGVYYIVYTVDCYKYGDYQLVRKVTVTEVGENG